MNSDNLQDSLLHVTPAARQLVSEQDVADALALRDHGDHGRVDSQTQKHNQFCWVFNEDGAMVSRYLTGRGDEFFVHTNLCRGKTIISLPGEVTENRYPEIFGIIRSFPEDQLYIKGPIPGLGKIFVTSRLLRTTSEKDILEGLARHLRGDHGDLTWREPSDHRENEAFSSLDLSNNKYMLVRTLANGSATIAFHGLDCCEVSRHASVRGFAKACRNLDRQIVEEFGPRHGR